MHAALIKSVPEEVTAALSGKCCPCNVPGSEGVLGQSDQTLQCSAWSDSGNLGVQLCHHCDVAVRVNGLSGFQKIQEDQCVFPIPEDSAHQWQRLELLL
jgi:hypothetical protein